MAKVTFGVRHVKLSSQLRASPLPLTCNLPVVSAVQCGFTNPPEVEMRYTGNASRILNVAQSTLLGVINAQIANVFVLLNCMVVLMDLGRYDFLETCQMPVGVVRLSALQEREFTLLHGLLLNDIQDMYCMVRLSKRAVPHVDAEG